VHAQQKETYRKMLRVYEDNDIINILGQGTDQGYTNGTRIDYFYSKNKPSRFFIDRLMPKAGDSSINTYGYSIMQVMITPMNIAIRIPDRSDYPYSGALFATHSLYATNPVKKYNWQTELMLGVMGPPSLAKQTQKLVHKMNHYIMPMGWDYQLKTDLLLNVNVTAEKELLHINKAVEIIGGVQGYAGTALNGASVYSLIRFGKMEPYFNGFISQFANSRESGVRRQLYFVLRPSVEWMWSNALIDGGIFNRNHKKVPEQVTATNDDEPEPEKMKREPVVAKLDYGLVVSAGRVSISFTQTTMTPMVKGVGGQKVGNISFLLAW
jgi:hypothetical protein